MRPQGHRASAGRRDGGPPSSSSVLTSPAPLWDLSLPPARDPPFPLSVAAGPCSRVRPRGDTAKQWMGEGRGVRGCSLPVRAKLGHLRGRSAGAGVVRAGAAGNSTRLSHAPPPRCRGLHPGSPPTPPPGGRLRPQEEGGEGGAYNPPPRPQGPSFWASPRKDVSSPLSRVLLCWVWTDLPSTARCGLSGRAVLGPEGRGWVRASLWGVPSS